MSKQKKTKKTKKKEVFRHVCLVREFDGEIVTVHFRSAKGLGEFIVKVLTDKTIVGIAQIIVPTAKMKVG